jgi:UDP-N-acetylmuramoylalanine--D-glutamate ligase
VIGDIELFAQARAGLPPHKVVGITGTNGKSTTTALVHHIMKTAGVPTTMGGNIGLPILAQEPLPAGGVYVLELSSYQIDLTFSLDCDVAVLLNITPDHLDRYDGFAAYAAAKERLLFMQSAAGIAFVDWQLVESATIFDGPDQPAVGVNGLTLPLWADQNQYSTLKGPHNAQNAAAAIACCAWLGIDQTAIETGLRTYPGLPHRMERVGTREGVTFINDSKATNAEAAAPALAAFPAIRWILGGRAKSAELGACEPHLGHVRSAYTIGEAGPVFAALLRAHMPVTEAGTLDRAVAAAAKDAQSGDVVLLSPACASFDQFRDFEDRGDQFRLAVKDLTA